MGVVIINDDLVEAILEADTVYAVVDEDSNVVVLICVPAAPGHDLGVWRDARRHLRAEGRGNVLVHRWSAHGESAHALATVVRLGTAVAHAALASRAVTLRP